MGALCGTFQSGVNKMKMEIHFSFFIRYALLLCMVIWAASCATQEPAGKKPTLPEEKSIEDYLVIKTPDETPIETSDETPVETPTETPAEMPSETLEETLTEAPTETSAETPTEIPVESADISVVAEPPKPAIQPPPEPDYLSIVAVGDNLYHDPMITLITKKNPVNPVGFYSEIAPLIENADIAFVNQETVLAGKDFGYSGYPQFNTPQNVGEALIATGFNVVNHATNHIMDKGEKAVFATMDFWDTHPEIIRLGINRSEETSNQPVIIEKNNITVGFLSYTYGTNGLPVPKSKPYLVSLIDTRRIIKDIDALRPNCDLLVVSMHWGEEYRFQPTKEQERLAQLLADHKADIIIGHHPHVLEPAVFLTGKEGNTTLCAYSLGNFLSAQADSPTLLGGMLMLRIKKHEGMITIESTGVLPLVTHYETDYTNFKVYPLPTYTDKSAEKHLRALQGKDVSVRYFTALANRVLGNMMIENVDMDETLQPAYTFEKD
ncbi:MAG: CapA family protein [Treponema sp.]|jgi:poly-gamma-glutamate synthesis protein (capsule biosynthesis protein)|nr:CapA family protein [Treponema sp.]